MDGGQEKEEERKEGGEGGRRGEECGYSDGLSSLSALSFEVIVFFVFCFFFSFSHSLSSFFCSHFFFILLLF